MNFETDDLATQLQNAGLDLDAPAFFAWLGVVPYLTLPAFRATLAFIAGRPTGSGVVFDYGQPLSAIPFRERLARKAFAGRVARAGEPFQLYLTTAEAARELDAFYNLEDLGADELNSRYFANRTDKLRLWGHSGRLVSAWL